METRKIVIVDSATNRRVDINTDATTFGELKRAASAAGIDYEGKDWLEGLTKSTPVSDDSLLPVNVMHKGEVTNNLVYMLTNTNKKIKSGGMTRSQMYAYIKENNLAEEIKSCFGKCYSSVSSDALEAYLNTYTHPTVESTCTKTPVNIQKTYDELVYAAAQIAAAFPKKFVEDVSALAKTLHKDVKEFNFTSDEIDDMFNI